MPNQKSYSAAFFALSLALLSLSLGACGKVETNIGRSSDRTDPKKKVDAITVAGAIEPELLKLAEDCAALKGRLNQDGTVCLTKITVTLPSFGSLPSGTSEVEIDPSFHSGKYLVATGEIGQNQNAVDLLFAGRAYKKIPISLMANFEALPKSGKLSFYVNSPDYSNVSATVWSCFERKITNPVYCSAKYIPGL